MDGFSVGAFLEEQSQSTISKLYEHPLTCLAVFRLLPDMAKHYVMRLVCLSQKVPLSMLVSWVNDKHQARHKEAMEKLRKLRLFQPDAEGNISLHPDFKDGLQTALAGRGHLQIGDGSQTVPDTPEVLAKKISDLDAYCNTRWEELLHFMVGYNPTKYALGIKVMEFAGLMQRGQNGHEITSKGWQYLLLDTTSQVWFLILHYLQRKPELHDGKSPVVPFILEEALNFLFQLSFSTLGQAYPVAPLTAVQVDMLHDLRAFGLIRMKTKTAPTYSPTRLAINMASGLSQLQDAEKRSYIIVETNLRVYAYTDNTLEISMLGNFIKLLYRFPGFVVGIICRESIREALFKGITAEQICNFLKTHAHPQMKTQKPIVPANVTHQINLWEAERNRLTFNDAALYEDFANAQEYEAFLKKAQEF
eukprot:Ihof_evm1s389 gene=Ihof_evmTU1s389